MLKAIRSLFRAPQTGNTSTEITKHYGFAVPTGFLYRYAKKNKIGPRGSILGRMAFAERHIMKIGNLNHLRPETTLIEGRQTFLLSLGDEAIKDQLSAEQIDTLQKALGPEAKLGLYEPYDEK